MLNSYQVQRGDTIREITRRFQIDWKTLKSQNPDAVGRSKKNGNWFLKEGATLQFTKSDFQQVLSDQKKSISTAAASSPGPQQLELAQSTPQTIEHTIQSGETLWELAVKRYHVNLSDIIRLNGINDPRSLQPGQVIHIPLPEKSQPQSVVASWYGEDFHGRPMANGQIYDMHGDTIAHKEIPLGTRVELTNTKTGKSVRATVTDRGPYIDGRDVDLSYGLAQKLSLVEKGVGDLMMEVL